MEKLQVLEADLARAINSAGIRLMKKISTLNINNLPISDYNRKYFMDIFGLHKPEGVKASIKHYIKRRILGHMYKYPDRYVIILGNLLRGKTLSDLQKMCFLDHGGGSGALSLLAAELGYGRVYYNDIYEVSCDDSACIAKALGHKSIIRIPGDIREIEDYCESNDITFDHAGSYDVIEHIYDIHGFIKRFPKICAQNSRVFFYSGANSYNPQIVQELSIAHDKIERVDREYTPGWKNRDSLRAYSTIRADIIKNHYLDLHLPEPEECTLDVLTEKTRGLMIYDIKNAIDTFLTDGTLPVPDTRFPSNTCDPMTGNWAEHLMDFEQLLSTVNDTFDICYLYPAEEHLSKARAVGIYAERTSRAEKSV